jgi:choline dehydrogenase-like flavoprotein
VEEGFGWVASAECVREVKLRGISRLRVADASVMPSVVSGNPQAATYAMAERAASLIAGDKPAPLGS